ncbi:MAG TPA: DNA gyrase subunit A [Candidatus Saccharimonadales bacterium]
MANDKAKIPEPEIEITPAVSGETVRSIEMEMEESYLQYSMSVIVSRALPDVRDGLKPVHRRILHVMNNEGLRASSSYRKSATVVGSVMGDFHPHGDQAIYDAMVRLAQDFNTRYLLVDGQGNFGSMDGDPPAAMRYTEARMTRLTEEMLADIDKETVDFRPNYDGRKQEPVVLPAKVPNLLLNGQLGIAVGMATNIPPHNLGEIVDAVIELIDNQDASLDDLLKHVKGPDFPTGGVVYGGEPMRAAYGTGKGSVIIRAVAEVIEDEGKRNKSQIIITEIPYGVNKAGLIEKIADLVKNKKITTISDIRDESARGTVQIVIDLRKDSYPKKVLNQLYKLTPLQTAFHYNMLALVDGIQPRVLGLEEILKEYLKHRQQVVRRRTEFELKKAEARAHILEGLKTALDHIDEVIDTIRKSQTAEDAQANLIKKFKLSELQARAILAMQLRTLAGLERQKIEDELTELKTLIKELKTILGDEAKILGIIKDELIEIKDRFGDKRHSKIITQELGKFSEEELIPNEQVVVTLTAENYIKRNALNEYRKQGRGGKGKRGITTKEEDLIAQLTFANTHDFLLFFTNRGRVFRLKVYEIPKVGLSAKGVAIVNLLQLQPDEAVSSMIRMDKDVKAVDSYLFMCTKFGTVKKTLIESYQNIRTSGLIAINLDDDDELKWIRQTTGENEIIISTSQGQSIRFHEGDVRPMGRTARGVRGIRLRQGDEVIDMNTVKANSYIFVISQNGYGKRTKIEQFTAHRRGGVGIKSAIVNSKTGKLVGVRTLTDDADEVIIISKLGQTIRLGLKDISAMGRTTQGVRIMRLNQGDSVASMALIKEQEEKAAEASEQTKPAAPKPGKTA